MVLETKEVQLRILTADEGKLLISKQTDDDGNPIMASKEIYLGVEDSEDNYIEVDCIEEEYMEVEEYGN